MVRRKKIIQVPFGTIEKICRDMNCRKTAVYDALNYSTDSKLANIIREKAISVYGGIKTSKWILR